MILNTALELGGDEGMELAKILVLRSGGARECWNDQPWMYTQILSRLMSVFGDHVWVPRGFSLCLVVVMLCASAVVAFGRWTWSGLIGIAVFWACSPHILDLNLSAMVEVPTFAFLMLGVCFCWRYCETGRVGFSLLGGLFCGFACGMKFVAAMYLPTLVLVLLVRRGFAPTEEWKRAGRWPALRSRFGGLGVFLVGALVAFLFTVLCSPSWKWQWLWESHVKASLSEEVLNDRTFEFGWRYLRYHEEMVVGALFGVLILVLRKQFRLLLLLVGIFASALTVHLNHKPFWYFYYLHLAIPGSILAGYGLMSSIEWIFASSPGEFGIGRRGRAVVGVLGASLTGAALFVYGVPRFQEQLSAVRSSERMDQSPSFLAIEKYKGSCTTLFTRRPILYYHSGLRPIPNLALLVKKRFWSGEITEEEVFYQMMASAPDLLHIDPRIYPKSIPVSRFLSDRYTNVWVGRSDQLWLRKDRVRIGE